jgi:hypothetical protein
MKNVRAEYHPADVASPESPFRQNGEPPFSNRSVDGKSQPVLYDHMERPIYRRAGFEVKP